jgi:hypothetical protein
MSLTYLAATVIAGVSYWCSNEHEDEEKYHQDGNEYGYTQSKESEYGDAYNSDSYNYSKNSTSASESHYRNLASDYSSSSYSSYSGGVQWTIADLPLALCLSAYVLNILFTIFERATYNKTIYDVREYFVPNNIDYMIHRYGEWTM